MFSQIYSVVFILKCLSWNNGLKHVVSRQRCSTTVANTLTHDGYGSVNITARRRKCKRVCDNRRSPLSGVKNDSLFHDLFYVPISAIVSGVL